MRKKLFCMVVGGINTGKTELIRHLTDPNNGFVVRGFRLSDALVIDPANLLINPEHYTQTMNTLLSQIRIWARSDSEVLIVDNLTITQDFKSRVIETISQMEKDLMDDIFEVGVRIGDPSMLGETHPRVTVYDQEKFKFLIDTPPLPDDIDEMCREIIRVYVEFSEKHIGESFRDS